MRSVILGMVLLGSVTAAQAGDSTWSSMKKWFENLKKGLESSAVESHHQKGHRVTAVAAVRGASQAWDDPKKPYLKSANASMEERARRKERKELASAIGLALEGKRADARSALDAFISEHPESPILDDAKEAREKLADVGEEKTAEKAPEKAEIKDESKAESKSEEKSAEKPGKAEKPEKPAKSDK